MTPRRIVSLLPSATEILYEIGAGDSVCAVTHRCTHPEEAKTKPKAITTPIDSERMSSREIDGANSRMQQEQNSAFVLDERVVIEADPDLIISQNTCEVCAAHTTHVGAAVRALKKRPHLYEMNPHTVEDVIASVADLARTVGLEERGAQLVRSLRERILNVSQKCTGIRPKTMVLEWTDPAYTAGHWVPDMVCAAGGTNMVSSSGERSRRTDVGEIAAADPDIIVVMACGFDVARASSEYAQSLGRDERWLALRAVREGRVFAVDADSYSSKPSHRIVTGIEILSRIIHPKSTSGISVPAGSFARL